MMILDNDDNAHHHHHHTSQLQGWVGIGDDLLDINSKFFVPIDCKEGGRHSTGVSIFQNQGFSVDDNLNVFCLQARKMDTNNVSPPLTSSEM